MKKISILLVIMTCLCLFTACTDYGYVFRFSVVGGNGNITTLCNDQWKEDGFSYVSIMGGEKASNKYQYKIEFVATPDIGYQVKAWTYNGQKVMDNKTIFFTAIITNHTTDVIEITVEFELIPNSCNI